jgi:ribonucleoside-diphosphate reductase alpha chain
MTDGRDPLCTSLVDYVAKPCVELHSPPKSVGPSTFLRGERNQVAGESSGSPAIHTEVAAAPVATALDSNAPVCSLCGGMMQRAGSCFICPTDGTTSGCS